MRRTIFRCLLVLLAPTTIGAQDLVLTNANLVDPRTRTVSVGAVWIAGGRVIGTGRDAPANAIGERVDLGGAWLIPGLVDLHTHSFGNSAPGGISDGKGTAHTAIRVLPSGVVAFLDLFGAEDYILPLRDRQRTDSTVAALVFAAGPCFTAPRGHCSEYGIPTRTVRDPEDARRQVLALAAKRPDVVKIVYDHFDYGGSALPSLDEPTLRALVATASAQGLRTVVHFGTWNDAKHAILAGATALTHVGRDGVVPEDVVRLMAASGVALIPTLVVHSDLAELIDRPTLLQAPLLVALTADTLRAAFRAGASRLDARTNSWIDRQRSTKAAIFESVRRLHATGVPMLVGTDAGNWGVVQGYSVHREMLRLVEAGLSPWDALEAGTTAAADFLGHRFGFRPGDEAHFVALAASPLVNIENTQQVVRVILGGRTVFAR